MCWVCETVDANALLVLAERVLGEAETMRMIGVRMRAQARGDKHRATLAEEAGDKECEE